MIPHAIRSLLRTPTVTIVVVVTLALGIGANTATFSVLKSIALNPLPYRDPDRLVTIAESDSKTPHPQNVAFATMYEWQVRSHSFQQICMWGDYSLRPLKQGHADFLRGMAVNYDFFDTLGIGMMLGRDFSKEDDLPETGDKLILSYALWMNYFGGDPNVLGRVISTVGDSGFTVIGVLPPTFHPLHMSNPGEIPQFYVPLGFGPNERACRSCRNRRVMARLKPGVSARRASAELNAIMQQLAREYPADYPQDAAVLLIPLREALLGRFDTALMILFGAVGLLLLLACSNVASLLLVRATGRRAEMALRAALGAGWGRLVRQMLTESCLLFLLGGIFGTVCALATTRVMAHFGASEIPRIDEIGPNGWMLGWGFGVSFLTGLLFGMVPAIEATRIDLRAVLQGTTTSSLPRQRHTFLNALVAGEIALAFILVTGVGLLGKSYLRLLDVNLGYDARNVLTLSLLPAPASRATAERLLAGYDAVANRMKRIPGVEEAGYASTLPLSHPQTHRFYVRERAAISKSEAVNLDTYFVSPGYLRVMKIVLLRGRFIEERDKRGGARVALVSKSCGRREFEGRDPIGEQIQIDSRDDETQWTTVVGVVEDVHQYGLDQEPGPAVYLAYAQARQPQGYASLVVRSRVSPESVDGPVRAALLEVDPTLPIFHVQPMAAYISKSTAERTFALYLIGVFGLLALVLAAIGIYGAVAYTIGLRTREIGIRTAVGANPSNIYVLVVRQVLPTALAGLSAGLGISVAFRHLISSFLFHVAAGDATVTCGVAALTLGVTLMAGYLPAKRAAGLTPMEALRIKD